MTIANPSTFAFYHADQADTPGFAANVMKSCLDSQANYLSSYIQTILLPGLHSTAASTSGAAQIGSPAVVIGSTKYTVYGQLTDIESQVVALSSNPMITVANSPSTAYALFATSTSGDVGWGAVSVSSTDKIAIPSGTISGDMLVASTAGVYTRLAAAGSTGYVLYGGSTTAAPQWGAVTPGDAEWQTPASTFARVDSTSFTVTYDSTTASYFVAGRPIRWSTGGTSYYYDIITALSTAGVATIAGAPLSTSASVMQYGNMSRVVPLTVMLPSRWSTGAQTTLINTILKSNVLWRQGPAYCVQLGAIVDVDDSGANQPRVNCTLASNYLSTANSTAGLQVAETWGYLNTAINTSYYDIAYGEEIEITTDGNGSNDDCADLTLDLVFVLA